MPNGAIGKTGPLEIKTQEAEVKQGIRKMTNIGIVLSMVVPMGSLVVTLIPHRVRGSSWLHHHITDSDSTCANSLEFSPTA